MKLVTISAIAIAGLAFTSCNTARSVGNAAGGAVRATGNTVGSAAQGTVDAGRRVGGAVKNDVTAAGRAVSGN